MIYKHLIINAFLIVNCQLSIVNSFAQTKKVGDYIENMSYNEMETRRAGAPRPLQYRPEGDGFVSVNGKNRFTRALYGSHTLFRIETSDRPVFGIYNKTQNRHIAFKLKTGDGIVALDSTEYCRSIYIPGKRDYELRIANCELRVSVQAFYDKEGAIWKFSSPTLPSGDGESSREGDLGGLSLICQISEITNDKLQRNGDMGADPPDAFDAPTNPQQLKTFEIDLKQGEEVYVAFENSELFRVENAAGEKLYNDAETARFKIANTLKINTPDPYINTLGGVISTAADGIWDGEVWLHGAIGWRMPLPGWRAAYTGDFLGWHDRARIHFDNYAASQVVDIEPVLPQPQQDSTLHLARAAKKWGTPMYSNGYICRNPRNNRQMHHYDMNQAYMDELLWHLQWTGDLDYARQIFSVIKLSLEWEKRNWDPDGDGLYEAYASTWASDALMYNSGGTTTGSAYNYRANKIAAEIAGLIGENPAPYRTEAEKIFNAVNEKLWLKDRGWWAEYVDFMGNKMIHPHATIASIYTAIDSEIGDIFQDYQATRYIDEHIPHIRIEATSNSPSGEKLPPPWGGLENGLDFFTISTSSWLPYAWSLNNVAHAEVGHTALAYWLAGRPDEAFNLFKSTVLDGMYLGNSPGNVGQTSYYDAARGECYRDFGDPVGVYSRAVVQGLFGITPDALHGKVVIRPGFPKDWDFAEIQHVDLDYRFERKGMEESYLIKNKFWENSDFILEIPVRFSNVKSLKINGKSVKWTAVESVGFPKIKIDCGKSDKFEVKITYSGKPITPKDNSIQANSEGFVQREEGKMRWWQPVEHEKSTQVTNLYESKNSPEMDLEGSRFETVNIDNTLNASVTDIFKNEYLSPRSPYTTMQTPTQGVGEWCHPLLTCEIVDSGFRAAVKNEVFETPFGVPFRIPDGRNNIAFTTLWDNYPDSLSVALGGKAKRAYLLMAGTTNAMQYGVTNGTVTVYYMDGTRSELVLTNPETWCPIEQDYYADGLQFKINAPRPYRVAFKTGIVSRDMEKAMNIEPTEVYGREIDGGAGIILDIPLDENRELKLIQWKAVANEVIVGMMAVTLVKSR
ncbi:MAG: DUF4450 domain-containing protein [Tannerella sp.]|jgi:hypothetical protein|nr:DUF4450 domain-containing protein [Tannerella sp.]